jgi:WD repeat-containing protein 61
MLNSLLVLLSVLLLLLQVKLWELSSRSLVQTISEHTDQVWSCAFSSDGSRLASVGDDKQLVVYSVA